MRGSHEPQPDVNTCKFCPPVYCFGEAFNLDRASWDLQKGHTREHAEATSCLLNSWVEHVVSEVATCRDLSPREVLPSLVMEELEVLLGTLVFLFVHFD